MNLEKGRRGWSLPRLCGDPISPSIGGKLFIDILTPINMFAAFPLLEKKRKLMRNSSRLQKKRLSEAICRPRWIAREILMKAFTKEDASGPELQLIFPEL